MTTANPGEQLAPNGWRLIWDGTTADGAFHLNTIVDVTGYVSPEHLHAARCRFACIVLATQLDDASIVEAYESMNDLFTWQIEKGRLIPKPIVRGVLTLAGMPRVARTPFVVDNEE